MSKEEIKRIIGKMIEARDLTPKEKSKSLDYWEGYTAAITKLLTIIKK